MFREIDGSRSSSSFFIFFFFHRRTFLSTAILGGIRNPRIGIESPRVRNDFHPGGALGPYEGRLLIFLVENDDDLSANIWFPEAHGPTYPTVRIFPSSSYYSRRSTSLESARQIAPAEYVCACMHASND